MNELQIKNQTIDSREVAEMMEMKHYQILEKLEGTKTVKGIIPTMTNHKIMVSEYFQKSTYKDGSGKENPCYLFTKMGCEFIANKFTGEKGVIFTAKYVKRFNEMVQVVPTPPPMSMEDIMIYSLQEMKNVKLRLEQQDKAIEETNNTIRSIRDAVIVDTQNWRKWVNTSINKLAESEIIFEEFGDLRYQKVRANTYKELETRAKCNLKQRLKNLKERLEKAGVPKTKILRTSNLEVIEQDNKLKEIYTAIIKNMLIKYQEKVS